MYRALCGTRAGEGFFYIVGTIRETSQNMMSLTPQATTSASEQDLRPRARTLSWMASLSLAAGELRAAEGYLLELLAWCAFGEHGYVAADGEL
jgi:hypothetical protein